MRKLATVQQITALDPIPGADKIEVATVLGWQVVVKKGEFKVGDYVVYIEIDSILPERPEFEFMRERKFRVRTIKLRQQVSQGICFPLSILDGTSGFFELTTVRIGDDVTDRLGIKKYDPQAEQERKETERQLTVHKSRMAKFLGRYKWYRRLFMKIKGDRIPMPSFITKTDEDRIQLFPNACKDWSDLQFFVTEKLDGQSATYFMIPNPKRGLFQKKWIFGVCSRNFQLMKPDNSSYWSVARKYDIEKWMRDLCARSGAGLIIQGEIIGPKIQGNKYELDEYGFYVFNMIEYRNGKRRKINIIEQQLTCATLGFNTVPWIEIRQLKGSIPEEVEKAKGYSCLKPGLEREGVVMRNYERDISFKVINPDFLLRYSA